MSSILRCIFLGLSAASYVWLALIFYIVGVLVNVTALAFLHGTLIFGIVCALFMSGVSVYSTLYPAVRTGLFVFKANLVAFSLAGLVYAYMVFNAGTGFDLPLLLTGLLLVLGLVSSRLGLAKTE